MARETYLLHTVGRSAAAWMDAQDDETGVRVERLETYFAMYRTDFPQVTWEEFQVADWRDVEVWKAWRRGKRLAEKQFEKG